MAGIFLPAASLFYNWTGHFCSTGFLAFFVPTSLRAKKCMKGTEEAFIQCLCRLILHWQGLSHLIIANSFSPDFDDFIEKYLIERILQKHFIARRNLDFLFGASFFLQYVVLVIENERV